MPSVRSSNASNANSEEAFRASHAKSLRIRTRSAVVCCLTRAQHTGIFTKGRDKSRAYAVFDSHTKMLDPNLNPIEVHTCMRGRHRCNNRHVSDPPCTPTPLFTTADPSLT